jgi:putative Holliday junction resolvase
MARVLAFDHGERRIGVAVADTDVGVATGLETVSWTGKRDLRDSMTALVDEQRPDLLVVGLPLNMDGSRGERCEAAGAFADRLRGWTGLPVEMMDERLTSVEADRVRREAGVSEARSRAGGMTDRAAAVLLLQTWLDSRSSVREEER